MFKIGSKVAHIKEPESIGFIVQIDNNLENEKTTCRVVWGVSNFDSAISVYFSYDISSYDIQWTNKLILIEE